ncbi:hypothetical protein EHI8A_045200 [Entamoeba histolytica HM-1:IMSS-B]|uniref:Cleavage stimulation factor subunit 2 hinge domain-containing protein n=8 Tax=Entamoeba TaxID=5758 RepID=A0A175JVN8_ENTHI|nr:uncharacterized protein EDI_216270 [Entamoeba dispar SAW760]XP_008858764.1 hypothetical protein ENU1_148330 [Entamoeba nuttalli P19]EMD46414.1 Hypothetical protein EHI5A_074960 [Entamoeba histolytica KU27]EMH75730.1 hypothetical protein EHI8A_045200 [Entamoeba histolytica HM-1:IMSS-B]EMS13085.1 hypothetical protein KM1_090060 [Entamoeba histolytica HM-3:IMSS]ENY59983.1 hypothetical protein EHI7A_045410 [Entamoeba histolytica HM-1:IMSS-A]GAT97821.1 hypothetical protein CL6EHI_c00137 [Entamo|eukprot:EDR24838.1 hypothetical protein EDI_216270 [Entamoeba dispar SAW760]
MQQPPQTGTKFATEKDVKQALDCIDKQQLLSAIEEVKKLVQTDRKKAKTILSENPSLAYGILEALHTMQMIDKQTYDALTGNNQ